LIFIILILLSRYCTFSYLTIPDMFIWNKFTEVVNKKNYIKVTRHPMVLLSPCKIT
jgi:hypothetical protein